MSPAVMRHFTLHNSILLAAFLFIAIWRKDFVESSPCEVVYEKREGHMFCQKTEASLSDLNRTLLVFKYKCRGKVDVYEICPKGKRSFSFRLNDCDLNSDTLIFCSYYKIKIIHGSRGYNKYVVLYNGTFQNQHSLTFIRLKKSGIRNIESGAFGCIKHLYDLDLSVNDIEKLPEDTFKCLPNLQTINLSNNRISIVPKCLRRLNLLKTLLLSDNFITAFSETALHEKTKLRTLDLNRNAIETICPTKIVQLENLLDLSLRENNITSFANNCFVGLKRLRNLDIGMNAGLVLTNESFVGLYQLSRLLIDGCGISISSKESGVFSNSPQLDKLDLQSNRLQEIHFDLFRELQELKSLNLSFNTISVLHNQPFRNNTRLFTLDLSNNILGEMKCGDFSSLYRLRHLHVSNNRIMKVAPDTFHALINLVTLNISNNIMSTTTAPSSRPMHAFQNIFPMLQKLRILDMSNSTSFPFELVFTNNNRNLKYLDVSFNIGVRIGRNSLVELVHLRVFISQGTNVKSFSYLFTKNKELREINLSGNKIKELERDNGLPFITNNLRKVDLSWNNIEEISNYTFYDCNNLKYLNISHNHLNSTLGEVLFAGNKRLNVLDVSYNNLSWIDWDLFSFVDNIWVSNNNIKYLSLSLFFRIDIRNVHLENNKIRRVPLDFLYQKRVGTSHKTTRFFLAKNPIFCDCNSFQLYEYVKQNDTNRRFSFEDLTCGNPMELDGREMRNLSPSNFFCDVSEQCPERCRCLKTAYNGVTVVNCSRKNIGRLPEFVPHNTTILDVGDNSITSLQSLNSSIWENLTEIHAAANSISSAEFHIPKHVKVFLLHGNSLTTLPDSLERHVKTTGGDLRITLTDNPWPCGCESLPLKYFLSKYAAQIADASEVRCAPSANSTSNLTLIEMKDRELCSKTENELLRSSMKEYILIGLTSAFAVLALGLSVWLFYSKNEHFVHAVLYTHCSCFYNLLGCQKLVEEDKTFDCFISYGSEDVDVPLAIVGAMGEDPDPEFKFCVHDRNWRGGSTISENIFHSVEVSRKTLIVISKTFVKNIWFHLEFQAALMQMLKDRRDRIIFVVKGDLPDYEDLPRDVRLFLRTRTYLVWGEEWFMEKLRYSLLKESVPFREQLREFLLKIGNCFRNRRIYHHDLPEQNV